MITLTAIAVSRVDVMPTRHDAGFRDARAESFASPFTELDPTETVALTSSVQARQLEDWLTA